LNHCPAGRVPDCTAAVDSLAKGHLVKEFADHRRFSTRLLYDTHQPWIGRMPPAAEKTSRGILFGGGA